MRRMISERERAPLKNMGFDEATNTVEIGTNLEVDGEIKSLDRIVDSKGNPRFIEGNLETSSLNPGITFSYARYSLSGTHLMLVLAGNVANGTTITNGFNYAEVALPKWIVDKIYPVWSNYIESKSVSFRDTSWGSQSAVLVIFIKQNENKIGIIQSGELTMNSNKSFRVQFDLLIDTD